MLAVYLRRLGWTALMGLSLVPGRSVLADEPARLGLPQATPIPTATIADPQKLAECIASHLEQAGTLKNYRVDVAVRAGVVELTGVVSDQTQRDEVLRLVQGVPGVSRVSDRLTVTDPLIPVTRLQAEKTAPDSNAKPRLPEPQPLAPPVNTTPPLMPPADVPLPGSNQSANGIIPEPRPIWSAHPGYAAVNAPRMPPYAWPTYAPYINYSRVAYPLAYPYKSWPFIGPIYPYPKVPLGWRSVKLEWDDGYWWFSKVGCKHDWWKLRYW
jgi:hypothetical protein